MNDVNWYLLFLVSSFVSLYTSVGKQLMVEENMSKLGLINLQIGTKKCPKHPLNLTAKGCAHISKKHRPFGILWLANSFQEVNVTLWLASNFQEVMNVTLWLASNFQEVQDM